jgi:hypothetical protein
MKEVKTLPVVRKLPGQKKGNIYAFLNTLLQWVVIFTTLLFAVLKFKGFITWGFWWVISPLWIWSAIAIAPPSIIFSVIFVVSFPFHYLKNLITHKP